MPQLIVEVIFLFFSIEHLFNVVRKKRKLMQLPTISFDKIFTDACPDVELGILLIKIKVAPSSDPLLQVIEKAVAEKSSQLPLEEIANISPLSSTRQTYKALGKDPSRYRPSAEALLRRVVNGKGLYQVNNVVDALNLVSVQSGFSIGGYDFEKIKGNIQLGRGAENEPYEAIGRGLLNIEGLPVLRDELGAFGSPTSDSTRTMVTAETTTFLAVIFGFAKNLGMGTVLTDLESLLVKYAEGERIGMGIQWG
jgi:DNA/RNA-binding domain of Phe-tRNA-synthetase-like protein